jgi:hypothetical protein
MANFVPSDETVATLSEIEGPIRGKERFVTTMPGEPSITKRVKMTQREQNAPEMMRKTSPLFWRIV